MMSSWHIETELTDGTKKQGKAAYKDNRLHISTNSLDIEYENNKFQYHEPHTLIIQDCPHIKQAKFRNDNQAQEFMASLHKTNSAPSKVVAPATNLNSSGKKKNLPRMIANSFGGVKDLIMGPNQTSQESIEIPTEQIVTENLTMEERKETEEKINKITIELAKKALMNENIKEEENNDSNPSKKYTLYAKRMDKEKISSTKGEIGCLPIFSESYKEKIHINHVTKWPNDITAKDISINWSLNSENIWNEILSHFKSKINKNGIFDFSWRGFSNYKEINDIKLNRCVKSCNIPIHFELLPNDIWKMILGKKTEGTCFRNARDILSNDKKWLSNCISNFYKIEMYSYYSFLNNQIKYSKHSLVNMYRHGIVGFEQIPLSNAIHLTPQTFLALCEAITNQQKMKLPPRIVSHNLVNQTKILGTLNKERHMLERHENVFSIALQMVIQQGLSFQDGQKISLSHFYLPTNTDKNVLIISPDSELGINNLSSLLYLKWTCEDCCDTFSKILLTNENAKNYSRFHIITNHNNNDSRWHISNEFFGLFDIPLNSLLDDLLNQYSFESILCDLLANTTIQSWINLSNYLLQEINNFYENLKVLTGNNKQIHQKLQKFIRVVLIILSSIGRFIYCKLTEDHSIISLVDDENKYLDILEDLQRCRISVNLLRILSHSEVFVGKKKNEETDFDRENLIGNRKFTRTTSLLVAGLLDYCLGACVFVNCKSGLDRTGLFVSVHNCLVSLWELYPHYRWELHLVCINYNSLRYSVIGGTFKISGQTQPPSCLFPNQFEEQFISYDDLVNILSMKKPKNIPKDHVCFSFI